MRQRRSYPSAARVIHGVYAMSRTRFRTHAIPTIGGASGWASNIAIRVDVNQNIAPCKKRSTDRIDGISALLTAIAVAQAGSEPKRSIYEDHGIRTLDGGGW